ncbi:DUF3027 domain-containing protein [Microbacterium sp. cx-55]|uniref:DUF3027 domain-containing protein n=1 Tax=Microbacterium sp. cx-55 TaxID=2875948 RepID=UPI001CC0A483|nr:DUF3027 domain-containing protein [Microbacterium sp. cx-55]MBZ4488167.1 DUF3027 domain-containing protein [Microbacterium sp. cx-55]UGB34426.1 DUF3027 domain-containing protein [Microbacterium sp. cx-55]
MTSTPDSDAPEGVQGDSLNEGDARNETADVSASEADAEIAEDVVEVLEAAGEIVETAEAEEELEAAEVVETAEAIVQTPAEPDPRLLAAHDLALEALHEITPAATVGPAADYAVEPGGAVSLRFHNRLPGYPGWYWTVTLAVVEGSEPTVLEVELMPGAGALLAPEWVPWATRLAEYHVQQAALAEAAGAADDESDDSESDEDSDEESDDLDDFDDTDASDFDEDGSSILHAGDVDGVDIDELDEDADDEDDEDDAR